MLKYVLTIKPGYLSWVFLLIYRHKNWPADGVYNRPRYLLAAAEVVLYVIGQIRK